MPLMTMNRDFIIKSTMGHVVRFTKDEPIYVVPDLYQEALKYGAELVDEKDKIVQKNPPSKASPQGQERHDKIKEAITQMLTRNERGDFTGSGLPALPVLDKLVGFAVESSERSQIWEIIQVENSGATASNESDPSKGIAAESVGEPTK